MIELYHHGSSVCAAKVRLVLAEKGLDWKGHYVDILNRLDMLGMSGMWTRSRPRLADWFERIKARPTFKPCFLDYCPPDLTNDLRTYGSQSWPEVRAMLGGT